jgi:MOSC domain-containing protein YiiM
MVIEHLCISPGHNFFGHFGSPAGENVTLEVESLECVAGRGVRGDRFFDYKPDYKGQITLFSMEAFEALCAALEVPPRSPVALRRNVFTRGVDLTTLIGQEFELQGVRLAAIEECRPCVWMDEAVAPGAEAWLKGRGGLRCKILTDGVLHRDAARN